MSAFGMGNVSGSSKKIADAEDNGQSVLLLSHHQLFSGFGDHIDLELENELRDFLDQHPSGAGSGAMSIAAPCT